MTDPAEITQHATQAQQAGGVVAGLGALGIAATAFAKLWRTIFGTPKERAEARAADADASAVIVDAAKDVIEAQREDTRRVRVERDDYAARLDRLNGVIEGMLHDIAELKRGREECDQRGERLERENEALHRQVAWQQRAINGLLRGSTPPTGLYTGDDVRAAMDSQQEE